MLVQRQNMDKCVDKVLMKICAQQKSVLPSIKPNQVFCWLVVFVTALSEQKMIVKFIFFFLDQSVAQFIYADGGEHSGNSPMGLRQWRC